MGDRERLLNHLKSGPLYSFTDWREVKDLIPIATWGVYTIWLDEALFYVGMSGRGLTAEMIANAKSQNKVKGLRGRLGAHHSGRRSGDRFCVYVSDRFVIRTLNDEQIDKISQNLISMDDLTREWIHKHLKFRFTVTTSSEESFDLENSIKTGSLGEKPILNPQKGD